MNQQLRSTLLIVPRPSDADDVRVTRIEGQWSLAWVRGKEREPFGPPFAQVSDATAAARMVREAHQL